MITDPVEKIIAEALTAKGIRFIHNGHGEITEKNLDFYLPDYDVYIECKQFHTDRSSEQLKRHPNVILIQGMEAAKLFAILNNKFTRPYGKENAETSYGYREMTRPK